MEKESVDRVVSDAETTAQCKGKRDGGGFVHSQVLRIREEDSHLGEDIRELLMGAGAGGGDGFVEKLETMLKRSVVDVMLLSRPILPCSPLGGKSNGNNKTIKSAVLH